MKKTVNFSEAISSYDRSINSESIALGEKERKRITELFPRNSWASMPIEKYALGQSGSENTFCAWLEYKSPHLGSISGGSAKKLLIYKKKTGEGWYFDPSYGSVEKAWEEVREGFVRAFDLAEANDWASIDQLKSISAGSALRVKTLHIYFPDRVLPVASRPHLLHFLKQLGAHTPEMDSAERMTLNQVLTQNVLSRPEFKGWTTNEIERFLYWWSDPSQTRRVVKIAPGEDAKYWDDCLKHGYIRVGWDEVGDLREFADKQEFESEFQKQRGASYKDHGPTIKKKGNELWQLAELEEGDVVVANKGISKILAVGEVVSPGYEWKGDLPEYRHTVHIKWDPSYAQDIEPQKRWALVTVANVPPDQYESILAKTGKKEGDPTVKVVADPMYTAIADALERKGQLILYGPPGTGKTYAARRFAVWWMLKDTNQDASAALASQEAFSAAERRLTTTVGAQRVWWVVANPKEWKWDVLFSKGSELWRRGRMQKHYSAMRQGDLVVGYQASPDKRVMAIAKVSKTAAQLSAEAAGFEIVPVRKIAEGPTHSDLMERPVLQKAEPFRFNNQGTLFALTPEETEELADLIGENDPEAARLLMEESLGVLTWTTFHPSYAYEDFVEGLRPFDAGEGRVSLKLDDGLFKRVCRAAENKPQERYLLIIDEINRANVSKVFGELITVLEKDSGACPWSFPRASSRLSCRRTSTYWVR